MSRGQYQGKSPDPGTIAGRSERVTPGTAGIASLRHQGARYLQVWAGRGISRNRPAFRQELSDPTGILFP
jgi:hypothetical protein